MVVVLALCLAAALVALAWLVARERARSHDLTRLTALLEDHEAAPVARARLESADPALVDLARAIDRTLDAERDRELEHRHAEERFREQLSALSHDLRTPLAGALGYLQLAQRAADASDAARYIERADERLRALRALVDDLFAYARAADPSFSPELSALDAAAVVAEVLAAHYAEFAERGWEPVVELAGADGTPVPPVTANAEALSRVVENLVGNALAHGSGAPTVRLSASATTSVTLIVENPVAPEAAARLDPDRLSERFYQGDPSRTRAQGTAGGTGLGLAVARELAASLGARLDVAVTPAEGPGTPATFRAALSLRPAPRAFSPSP